MKEYLVQFRGEIGVEAESMEEARIKVSNMKRMPARTTTMSLGERFAEGFALNIMPMFSLIIYWGIVMGLIEIMENIVKLNPGDGFKILFLIALLILMLNIPIGIKWIRRFERLY